MRSVPPEWIPERPLLPTKVLPHHMAPLSEFAEYNDAAWKSFRRSRLECACSRRFDVPGFLKHIKNCGAMQIVARSHTDEDDVEFGYYGVPVQRQEGVQAFMSHMRNMYGRWKSYYSDPHGLIPSSRTLPGHKQWLTPLLKPQAWESFRTSIFNPPKMAIWPPRHNVRETSEVVAERLELSSESHAALDVLLNELRRKDMTVKEMFRRMDVDGDGSLSRHEIRRGVIELGIRIGRNDLNRLLLAFDQDNSGLVDYHEILQVLAQHRDSKHPSKQLHGQSDELVDVSATPILVFLARHKARVFDAMWQTRPVGKDPTFNVLSGTPVMLAECHQLCARLKPIWHPRFSAVQVCQALDQFRITPDSTRIELNRLVRLLIAIDTKAQSSEVSAGSDGTKATARVDFVDSHSTESSGQRPPASADGDAFSDDGSHHDAPSHGHHRNVCGLPRADGHSPFDTHQHALYVPSQPMVLDAYDADFELLEAEVAIETIRNQLLTRASAASTARASCTVGI